MNVVLIGFMASGKTSVGRRLAQRLGYRFLDTDQFIEGEMGCSIAELFTIQGEAYFRDVESRLAARMHGLQNTVISTGGGLPITPGNLEHLKRAGAVVFLKADLEDILKRLERDTRRPKVQGGDLRDTVTRLLVERLPAYEQADLVVESHGKSVNRVCGEIIRYLGTRRVAEREAAAHAAGPEPAEPAC
jgi:shikimate kinase